MSKVEHRGLHMVLFKKCVKSYAPLCRFTTSRLSDYYIKQGGTNLDPLTAGSAALRYPVNKNILRGGDRKAGEIEF